MTKGTSGNRVDWVAALEKGQIAPRFDLHDPDKQPMMLDLDIVREVKGTMPNVVYPHKQHTEWLDCSNCHPGIFIPVLDCVCQFRADNFHIPYCTIT